MDSFAAHGLAAARQKAQPGTAAALPCGALIGGRAAAGGEQRGAGSPPAPRSSLAWSVLEPAACSCFPAPGLAGDRPAAKLRSSARFVA